jgi:DNA-binding XRE family transcriptional regulator
MAVISNPRCANLYTTKDSGNYTMATEHATMQLVGQEWPPNQRDVLTPRQLRAARALLGWSRAMLADKSGVPVRTIENFEAEKVTPLLTTAGKLRLTLERAGVIFQDADREAGPGVRLRDGRIE